MKERMRNSYRPLAMASLALVYLVILAGAVVRMTGSGMGCPDWPKCFGYLVPPTQEEQLLWTPGKDFKKGQVIIREEALLLAREDFRTGTSFDPGNWAPYTRHDYSVFNATHTWIEYINRLLGALAGLAMLAMALVSLAWWRERKSRVLWAWLGVIAIGFQGWLGATVVYSVLEPVRITLHMFMALLIVAILLWIIMISDTRSHAHRYDPLTRNIWWFTVGLSLLQILMGTQVRQYIDVQAETFGLQAKGRWLENPGVLFYVHRSFSIALLLLHLWAAYRVRSLALGFTKIPLALGILIGIIGTGVGMNYFAFPWGSQALHLVLASILFGLQLYALMELARASRKHISS